MKLKGKRASLALATQGVWVNTVHDYTWLLHMVIFWITIVPPITQQEISALPHQ